MDFPKQRHFAEKVRILMRPELCRPASDLLENRAPEHGERSLSGPTIETDERCFELIRPQRSWNAEQGRYPTTPRLPAGGLPICIDLPELASGDADVRMSVKITTEHPKRVRLEHVIMVEKEQVG